MTLPDDFADRCHHELVALHWSSHGEGATAAEIAASLRAQGVTCMRGDVDAVLRGRAPFARDGAGSVRWRWCGTSFGPVFTPDKEGSA